MKPTLRIFPLLAASILLLQTCQKGLPHILPLAVTSLSPSSGSSNTTVVIKGTGFSTVVANDLVYFNGKQAVVTAANDTLITTTVPSGAGTGAITISVNGSALLTGPVFTYVPSAIVSTVAGTGITGSADGPAGAATFQRSWGIVVDSKSNLFVSSFISNGTIREISQGVVSTVANPASPGTPASFVFPGNIAIDASDNLYVTGNAIKKITSAGAISTIITPINPIYVIAVDASGNFYTADATSISKTLPTGATTIFAGSAVAGKADGTGAAASFNDPIAMAFDKSGNLYVVDNLNSLIRKITPAGVVTTVAGSGVKGAADGKGTAASFSNPTGIAVDATGNLYIADTDNNTIRKITTDGTVTTIAGSGQTASVDGVGTAASFFAPYGLAFDASGNLYVTDFAKIRKIVFN